LISVREAEKTGAIIDSSVVGYSPDSNNVSTEAKKSPLLEAVARERLVKTQQAGEYLAGGVVIFVLWT
jgi:hypothetical protein